MLHALAEGGAGTILQQFGLAGIKHVPDRVFLGGIACPALGDGPVGGRFRRPVRRGFCHVTSA